MMTKSGMNLQDSFLNQVRKDNQEILLVLLDGARLTGYVRGFDNFTVILGARGQQHLIYKHAIAQIISRRPMSHGDGERGGQRNEAHPQPVASTNEASTSDAAIASPEEHPREERQREERPRREGHARRDENARDRERKEEQARRDRFNTIDLTNIKVEEPKS